MRGNHVRRRLKAGEPSIGTWLSLPSPEAAEYCSKLGFDWLTIDVDIISDDAVVSETAPGSNDFAFAGPFETATLTAVVTYTVGDAPDQEAQNATAVLAGSGLTIAQD